MVKKLALSFAAAASLAISAGASAAIISTPTQTVFTDTNGDTVFDSADYQNPAFTELLTVNQFDDNGGLYNLVSVTLTLEGYMEGQARLENISTTATSEVSITIASELELKTSTGTTLVTVLPEFNSSFSATVFDGTLDYGGTSGTTIVASPQPIVASQTVTITDPVVLAMFLGTGTIGLDLDAVSSSVVMGNGGDVFSNPSVVSGGLLDITYNYSVPDVSAPSTMAILGLGLAFAGFRSRRRNA